MFKSATLKLTLWYVLFITALSLIFSVGLYYFANQELTEALNSESHLIEPDDHDSDDVYRIDNREYSESSHQFLNELIFFDAFVIVGSSVLSYIFAKKTLDPIEKAHQAQVRFTAEASHELRTPLTAMKLDTEVTLMQPKSSKSLMLTTLKANLRDISRLEKLAEHLLDISRYDYRAVRPTKTIRLKHEINLVLEQFNSSIVTKKLKLKVMLENLNIDGDEYSIAQLMAIILDNAIKYNMTGGELDIELKSESKWAVLIVKDQGSGIDEQDLPHLFERFYRSTGNLKTDKLNNVGGYGLGLSLAKEIVTAHRGQITIKNRPKGGAEVKISLPLAKK